MFPIDRISSILERRRYLKRWKLKNKHNHMMPKGYIPLSIVTIGNFSYGTLDVMFFNENSLSEKLIIGSLVSIAPEVKILLSGEHRTDSFSTFPVKVKVLGSDDSESISKGAVTIEDDCWIGFRSIILSGVTIGKGAVVAAGSVVTKSVPPFSIVGGNPAKLIRPRFSDERVTELLMRVDFSQVDRAFVERNQGSLYSELTYDSCLRFCRELAQPQDDEL